MSEFEIKPAVRENAPITAAIIGGSGAGKTLSALKFARGLVGHEGVIVVIDSEGGRPKIYSNTEELIGADGHAFHILSMVEPYTSERFTKAFRAAEKFGVGKPLAIIVDTVSHEHEGFLEYADQEEARMSSRRDVSRAKWTRPKATRKRFYSAISSSSAHVIVTIRLNRIVDMDAKPPKEIYKPECDKDLPYRMDLSMEVSPDHTIRYIKVPEPLKHLVEEGVKLSKHHGEILMGDMKKHQKPNSQRVISVIRNLEQATESGIDTFKIAWEAAWRNADEDERKELRIHLERLKRLAFDADTQGVSQPEDPGDLSNFSRSEPDKAASVYDDETFPGDAR